MACHSPLRGYRNPETGKLQFTQRTETMGRFGLLTVPCGMCMGCRIDYSREWAIRCVHESKMHKQNAFVTLTYDNYFLPEYGSLRKSHVSKFIKALRQSTGKRIKFFASGEYGSQTDRPHYHILLFGYDFPDKKLVAVRDNNRVYLSQELKRIWGKGQVEIGSVTYQSS